MHYVYVLKKPDSSMVYIGYSANLKQRIAKHSRSANHRGWFLVYYEAYRGGTDARMRERKLKHYGSSLGQLKARIGGSLKTVGGEWAGSQ